MRRLSVLGCCLAAAGCTSSGGGAAFDTNSGPVKVTYFVTGSASGTDVTYSDGSGAIEQQQGLAVPVRGKHGGSEGITVVMQSGDFAQISAQNTQGFGSISCRIEADGVTIKTATSRGGYAIASCSETVP